MVVSRTIEDLKQQLTELRGAGQTIGFVPTMGALHDGHISLIRSAREANDIVISSIFVNPIQFNNSSDYQSYPIDEHRDLETMDAHGCDITFLPDQKTIYPSEPIVKFDFGPYETGLEGAFRPGHFNGVAIVLSKMFHIVAPDVAYFGQKDLQQTAIVKRLVMDLGFDIKITVVKTVREADGLASSSRNRLLRTEDRTNAVRFYQALEIGRNEILKGTPFEDVSKKVEEYIEAIDNMKLEYFEMVNSNSLEPIRSINSAEQVSLCIAGYVGSVRLLDNIYLKDK